MSLYILVNDSNLILARSNTGFLYQSDPTRNTVVIWVNFFQTELMVEIYPKSPVRAIGKVLLMKCS